MNRDDEKTEAMLRKIKLSAGFLLMLSASLFGQAERKYIRQGNKEYEQKKFDQSELLYRKALDKQEDSYAGEFNLGDALYKQKKYEESARDFQRLAEDEKDPVKLSQLYHNMGNALLQSKQLEQSIAAYENALRNNPRDEETRHNLAYAQSLLKQQQQQQQNKNKDQDRNQDQKDQNQQNQDQQNQDRQNQQQQEQQQQDQQQAQQNQGQENPQQAQQHQISRQDAERMLQALQQNELKLQEDLKKQQARTHRVKVLKDW
jgi:Ca-activated chloride channel family protein